jgi:hypothetical protein
MGLISDFSHAPTGGRFQQVLRGLVIPGVIIAVAARCYIYRHALWFGFGHSSSSSVWLSGQAAQAMAGCYLSIGLFIHFRWFWGLVPVYRVFISGLVLSMIFGLGCFGMVLYYYL